MLLLYLQPQSPFPNDGIRFQDQEVKYAIPFGNARVSIVSNMLRVLAHVGRVQELEVHETKYGFIPGADSNAWRVRRRYRLSKGGHPSLFLVHYTQGPQTRKLPHKWFVGFKM